jgi:hypothetical protein
MQDCGIIELMETIKIPKNSIGEAQKPKKGA